MSTAPITLLLDPEGPGSISTPVLGTSWPSGPSQVLSAKTLGSHGISITGCCMSTGSLLPCFSLPPCWKGAGAGGICSPGALERMGQSKPRVFSCSWFGKCRRGLSELLCHAGELAKTEMTFSCSMWWRQAHRCWWVISCPSLCAAHTAWIFPTHCSEHWPWSAVLMVLCGVVLFAPCLGLLLGNHPSAGSKAFPLPPGFFDSTCFHALVVFLCSQTWSLPCQWVFLLKLLFSTNPV